MTKRGMKCENCGGLIVGEHRKYPTKEPPRFCSMSCAKSFSTKAKRQEINARVSKTLSCKYRDGECWKYNFLNPVVREKAKKAHHKYIVARYGEWGKHRACIYIKSKIKGRASKKVELDITNEELEDYRKKHTICEICGKKERVSTNGGKSISRLAIDHDHENNCFRGLLCCDCNRKLGWYEAQKNNIEKYLAMSSNGKETRTST